MSEETITQSTSETPSTTENTPTTGQEAAPAATTQNTTATPAPAAAAGNPTPVLDAEGKPGAPQWQPNFKFRSYDKEFEIEEMYRGLIKDAESEKKVKALFEKAHGMDFMKPKYQKVREEHETLKSRVDKEYLPLARSIDEVSALYAKGAHTGELEAFFQKLQIPDEVLYKYVARRLDYTALTPEQKAAYDRSVQAQSQTYTLEQQNQMMQEQMATMQVQARTMELSTVLAKPDVRELIEAVDSRLGAGAFQNEVIREGQLAWSSLKKDLTAEEAVTAVVNRIRPIIQAGQSQTTTTAAPGTPAQGIQNPATGRPPVIPSVKGQGTSPVKKVPKSIDDLRKLAASGG